MIVWLILETNKFLHHGKKSLYIILQNDSVIIIFTWGIAKGEGLQRSYKNQLLIVQNYAQFFKVSYILNFLFLSYFGKKDYN
jgi:hypothetical protein